MPFSDRLNFASELLSLLERKLSDRILGTERQSYRLNNST
jgi:hypothetical protein